MGSLVLDIALIEVLLNPSLFRRQPIQGSIEIILIEIFQAQQITHRMLFGPAYGR